MTQKRSFAKLTKKSNEELKDNYESDSSSKMQSQTLHQKHIRLDPSITKEQQQVREMVKNNKGELKTPQQILQAAEIKYQNTKESKKAKELYEETKETNNTRLDKQKLEQTAISNPKLLQQFTEHNQSTLHSQEYKNKNALDEIADTYESDSETEITNEKDNIKMCQDSIYDAHKKLKDKKDFIDSLIKGKPNLVNEFAKTYDNFINEYKKDHNNFEEISEKKAEIVVNSIKDEYRNKVVQSVNEFMNIIEECRKSMTLHQFFTENHSGFKTLGKRDQYLEEFKSYEKEIQALRKICQQFTYDPDSSHFAGIDLKGDAAQVMIAYDPMKGTKGLAQQVDQSTKKLDESLKKLADDLPTALEEEIRE